MTMFEEQVTVAGHQVQQLSVVGEWGMVFALKVAQDQISTATLETDWCEDDKAYWVARCLVRKGMRGKGFGTRLMNLLVQRLDAQGKRAFLIPNPYDETISLDRLVAFYERFGFVRNPKGDVWVREPNGGK